MSGVEIMVALLVGAYAMIGGALVNASITAPRNAKVILDMFTHARLLAMVVVEILLAWAIIAIGYATGWYDLVPDGVISGNLVVWFCVGHALFEAVIYLCKWITGRLLAQTAPDQAQRR